MNRPRRWQQDRAWTVRRRTVIYLRVLSVLFLIGGLLIAPEPVFSACLFPDFHIDQSTFDNAMNKDCINFKIVNTCASQICADCVVVTWWEPRYAVTAVKIPGDRLLSDEIFQGLGAQVSQSFFNQIGSPRCTEGAGGGAHTFNTGNPGSRFYNIKVYSLKDDFSPQCLLPCGSNQPQMQLNYVSENDTHWKTAEQTTQALDLEGLFRQLGLPPFIRPLGFWQSLQPIGGHSKHPSHVVSAAIASARAVWLLTPGTRIPPPPLTTIPGELSLCFQPGWPLKYPCMPTGTPPTLWGNFNVSPRGKFLYFFWVPRACCVTSEQAACGLKAANEAAGSSGGTTGGKQNLCDIGG